MVVQCIVPYSVFLVFQIDPHRPPPGPAPAPALAPCPERAHVRRRKIAPRSRVRRYPPQSALRLPLTWKVSHRRCRGEYVEPGHIGRLDLHRRVPGRGRLVSGRAAWTATRAKSVGQGSSRGKPSWRERSSAVSVVSSFCSYVNQYKSSKHPGEQSHVRVTSQCDTARPALHQRRCTISDILGRVMWLHLDVLSEDEKEGTERETALAVE
jgi:hypothetical protein